LGLITCPNCNGGSLYRHETELYTEDYCVDCSYEHREPHQLRVVKHRTVEISQRPRSDGGKKER
jgi:hypothetical protein